MVKPRPIALVVHGHFYQPPRENPWTDEFPREPGAAPFHDWNARIHAECYRANAYARIFGAEQRIRTLVNNYERMSFNFGPTLARWVERHDPHTQRRIQEGDAAQCQALGHGGAIAQVWAHPITPLLSPRDRWTQIQWGLADFSRRFDRPSTGMWLPETAVNPATLDALIEAGVRFTILAPEQIAAVRKPGKDWTAVQASTVDSGRLYRWNHSDGAGRSIAIAIFNGPLSRDLAFGAAARDAGTFLASVRKSAEQSTAEGPCLVLAASDGELYGHHKKFADLTLAYAGHVAAADTEVEVTNLAAFLGKNPPTWEVKLVEGPNGEGSAWSCAHGLGRWRRHCGCQMHADPNSNQAWRGPLRDALDFLRDRAVRFFEDAGGDLFSDAWQARDVYGEVVDASPGERLERLRTLGLRPLKQGQSAAAKRALTLMEMQRSLLLMYASCSWFFDDIAGPEAMLAMRRAVHAMDSWRDLGRRAPESGFLDILAKAKSNDPNMGTGADVFRRASLSRVTPAGALAQIAFTTLVSWPGGNSAAQVPGFDVALTAPASRTPARPALAGRASVIHRRTGEETQFTFSATHDRFAGFECKVGTTRLTLSDLDNDAAQALRLGALVRLAENATTVAGCQSLLDMAKTLGPLSADETVALGRMFAATLVRFMEKLPLDGGDRSVWETIGLLADRAGLPAQTDDSRFAQEMVWEHLAAFRASRRQPPKALRVLAERLGFENG